VPTENILEEVVKEEVKEVIEKPGEIEELAEADEESTETMEQENPKLDKAVAANSKEVTDTELLHARQEMFLATLTKKINSNKYYPKSARRRGIEGEVEVAFQVCSNGNVDNITVISGHKAFKRSAIEAILKSFPIEVENSLFDFPCHFNVTLAYTLK
jgi:protein TonB